MSSRDERSTRRRTRRSRDYTDAGAYGASERQESGRHASSDSAAGRYSRNSGYAANPVSTTHHPSAQGSHGYVPATAGASQYSRTNTENYSHKRARKQGRGKRIALVIVIAIAVVLVGAGTAAALFVNSINQNLKGDKTNEEQMQIQEKLVATTSFNDPFWMLLIGSDAREDDADMGQRADTTILVRVDPAKQYVGMLSIPRDTMITYKGSTVKFNAAYAYDGAAGAIQAASDLCGVEISHYAEVDFTALESLVDAIGGVDIYVETRIDNWKAGDEIIEAGQQHLNGAQALVYARDRDYVDGDFTRTMHQRTLVKAMVDRVLALDVGSIPGVIQAVSKCVSTDLTANEVYSLAMQFKDMENFQMYAIMIPSTTATIDGVSYVLADSNGLSKVLQAMEQGIDPNTVVSAEDGATSGTNITYETGD